MHHLLKRQLGHARATRWPILLVGLAIVGATCTIAAPPASITPRVTLPGSVVNVVDGDTVDVELRLVVRVRLMADDTRGCWCPESRTKNAAEKKLGLAAKANMQKLAVGKTCLLHVPITSDHLIDAFTLERILGQVFVEGKSLGATQIEQGFAASTKGGKLGK